MHIGCELICRSHEAKKRQRSGRSTWTGCTEQNTDAQCQPENTDTGLATLNQGCCSQRESRCLHGELLKERTASSLHRQDKCQRITPPPPAQCRYSHMALYFASTKQRKYTWPRRRPGSTCCSNCSV